MSAAAGNPAPNPGGVRPQAVVKPAAKPAPPASKERLVSLDAYRGFVMVFMASEGWRLAQTASAFPDNRFWRAVRFQFSHADWVGGGFWDMIQPSFMFMVGVAMAYSCASRIAKGESWRWLLVHSLWRSVVLICLGLFLRSLRTDHIYITFEDVLEQIGLGYTFLFLLWNRGWKIQWGVAALLLVGYWCLFYFYPLPAEDFNYRTVGVPGHGGEKGKYWESPEPDSFKYIPGPVGEWYPIPGGKVWDEKTNEYVNTPGKKFEGVARHWDKNTHPAQAFDRWFLNIFPRPYDDIQMGRAPLVDAMHGRGPKGQFMYHYGGYMTLSFIPSLVTMLFGLLTGGLLRSDLTGLKKLGVMVLFGVLGIAAGELLSRLGVCPIVKRIWTPSWTLWSGGIVVLILAAFYGVIDLLKFRLWAFPLVVVGMNSLVMYCMFETIFPWIENRLDVFLGWRGHLFDPSHPSPYKPFVLSFLALCVTWSVCYWLYKKKAFVRI